MEVLAPFLDLPVWKQVFAVAMVGFMWYVLRYAWNGKGYGWNRRTPFERRVYNLVQEAVEEGPTAWHYIEKKKRGHTSKWVHARTGLTMWTEYCYEGYEAVAALGGKTIDLRHRRIQLIAYRGLKALNKGRRDAERAAKRLEQEQALAEQLNLIPAPGFNSTQLLIEDRMGGSEIISIDAPVPTPDALPARKVTDI